MKDVVTTVGVGENRDETVANVTRADLLISCVCVWRRWGGGDETRLDGDIKAVAYSL